MTSTLTVERNPIYAAALTIEDMKPGRRISVIHPHISPDPSDYTLLSAPFVGSSELDDPRFENHYLNRPARVEVLWEYNNGWLKTLFLTDIGVLPRVSGVWNTNFTVWRSHSEFAGKIAIANNPALIASTRRRLDRPANDEYPEDLRESW